MKLTSKEVIEEFKKHIHIHVSIWLILLVTFIAFIALTLSVLFR